MKFNKFFNLILKSTFIKFCVVGGVSTILNYSVFLFLFLFKINYLISSASGYIAGVFLGFFLNKKFTFKSESKNYAVEITKYFFVYAISLLLGLGFLKLLVFFGLHILIANIFVIGLTTITNFIGTKFFVFKEHLFRSKLNFLIYRYRYLMRYIIIGLGSIVIELLVIRLILNVNTFEFLIINKRLTLIIGFIFGMLFSFFLNSKINFPVAKKHNLRTFNMFTLISAFSFLLNLALIKLIFINITLLNYEIMRFISAAIIFIISYTLHRRFTFIDVKNVGIAIYMKSSERINEIKSKIKFFPDFIHMDLVDKSYNPDAMEVDIATAEKIKKNWPYTMKMVHIMSKKPSLWIKKIHKYVKIIVFHVEIDEDIGEVITLCRKYGCKPGICIFHDTPLNSIIKYLNDVDIVQILGITKPGESGQHLNKEAIETLNVLNQLKKEYKFEICFDGGVKLSNVNRIDAKYIVSGSTVLESDDPKKAIFDLKTSSKYYVLQGHELRKYLDKEFKRIIENTNYIKSGTIVGSYNHGEGLEGISDIDIILIVNTLTKQKFEEIVSRFKLLGGIIKTDFDHHLIINTTFGPLKFNKEKTVVFHLMIYDIEGHINHCKDSPFTCLDWQLSTNYVKEPMSRIYNVTKLQPNNFFSSRRSISDYLRDINKNEISYREYNFSGGVVKSVKKSKKMNNKDKFEFCYHILKFSMSNFLKLYNNENKKYETNKMLESYFKIFSDNKRKHEKFFRKIKEMKTNNKYIKWTTIHKLRLTSFLKDFEKQFKKLFYNTSGKILFLRHQRTNMNGQGIFLGQRLDPAILKINISDLNKVKEKISEINPTNFFSSPAKRSIQTINMFKNDSDGGQIILDYNLKEIDYGVMEGKTFEYLSKNFKDMIESWKRKEDLRFPNGENTGDVFGRLSKFINKLKNTEGNSIVCTHNVVIRCLIGSNFNIPMHEWHKLIIDYLDPMEVIITDNNVYMNLSKEQKENIFKKIGYYNN